MVSIRKETFFIASIAILVELIIVILLSIEFCDPAYLLNIAFFKESFILLVITWGTILTAFLLYYYQKKDMDINVLKNEINYIKNALEELDTNIDFSKEYASNKHSYSEVYYFPFKISLENLLSRVILDTGETRKQVYKTLK